LLHIKLSSKVRSCRPIDLSLMKASLNAKVASVRQTDNSLFYMANERTWRSSSQLTMGQSLCLLSCSSSDTQNTDTTLENDQRQKGKILIITNWRFKKRGNNNKDQIGTEYPMHWTFTRHGTYVKNI